MQVLGITKYLFKSWLDKLLTGPNLAKQLSIFVSKVICEHGQTHVFIYGQQLLSYINKELNSFNIDCMPHKAKCVLCVALCSKSLLI